jgi:hypothetical protein
MFEAKGLCYGVQWEIARMVTSRTCTAPDSDPFTFDGIVVEMLEGLKGSNADAAPKTPQHLLRLSAGISEHAMLRRAFATEMTARVFSPRLSWLLSAHKRLLGAMEGARH